MVRLPIPMLPILMSLAINAQGATLDISPPSSAHVRTFDLVEFGVRTGESFHNPFDPSEVAVDGVFSGPDKTVKMPAFWDGKEFRLRFCPQQPGRWKLQVSLRTPDGTTTSPAQTFQVAKSGFPGFVHRSETNPNYWATEDGKGFIPVGLNLCWPDSTGLPSYDRRFAKLRSVGGNFARIWTTQDKRLETVEAGLGKYDLASSAYYDDVFKLARKHDIRLMLTLDDYRVLAKTDYFNAHWDKSPYNKANGGPLAEPIDFFHTPQCRTLYKQRLRYLVARYAAFPSLAFWEIYNEQDNIPKPGVPTEWLREMTDYLKSIDPYRRPITTSYSWDDKAEVWELPNIDLVQRHMYGQGDTVDFVSMVQGNATKLERYRKPRVIGEFGITWKEPDIKLDTARLGTPLHDALWASIMSGDCGTALTWWWDNYLEPLDLWPVFAGISKFVASVDFAHVRFEPLKVDVPGLTAMGLQDPRTGEAILWLHDPASTWKNDAEGVQPKEWKGTEITVPLPKEAKAEIWDTREGRIVETRQVGAALELPPFCRDIALHILPGMRVSAN